MVFVLMTIGLLSICCIKSSVAAGVAYYCLIVVYSFHLLCITVEGSKVASGVNRPQFTWKMFETLVNVLYVVWAAVNCKL